MSVSSLGHLRGYRLAGPVLSLVFARCQLRSLVDYFVHIIEDFHPREYKSLFLCRS